MSEEEQSQHVTDRCNHARTVCTRCVRSWLESQLDSVSWNRIRCPECTELLDHTDVQRFASAETFERYDAMALRAALNDIPDFRSCLNPNGCNAGHEHVGGLDANIFECRACHYQYCVVCERPWHSGETCEEFRARTTAVAGNERASEAFVAENAKQCPRCHSKIMKEGCDHMTCTACGHDLGWLCGADYQSIFRLGNARHLESCQWYQAGGEGTAGW